jgi:hypothetical protein
MNSDTVSPIENSPKAVLHDLPREVLLRGVCRAGPLPWREAGATRVPPLVLDLAGWYSDLPEVSAGPLRGEDGVDQRASLSGVLVEAVPIEGAANPCEGRRMALRLQVDGGLTPGLYQGELRLRAAGLSHNLLVRVRIDAWWPWMLGAMLLGLVAFGVFNFFAQQQALGEQRALAFGLREEIQNLQGQGFGGSHWAGLGAEAGQALTAALGVLNEPRPLGVRDGRRERADALIRIAQGRIEALRADLKEVEPGEAAVRTLQGRWKEARDRLREVEALVSPPPAQTGAAPQRLAAAVDALDRAQADALVRPLTAAIDQGIGAQVGRVSLTYAGGAGVAAGHLAERVDGWLRRAMAALAERVDLALAWRVLGQDLRVREGLVRQQLKDPALDPDRVAALGAELDQSVAGFTDQPVLEEVQRLHAALGRVQTEVLRLRASALLEGYADAAARVKAEVNLGEIEAAFAAGTPTDTREQRQALLGRVLDLWQGLAERLDQGGAGGPSPAAMLGVVERLRGRVAVWDQEALSGGMRELTGHWDAYQEERLVALTGAAFGGFCAGDGVALGQELALGAVSLGLLEPRPEVAGLDPILDRLRLRLERLPTGMACLNALVALHGEALELGNRLFTTVLKYADIPLEQRLAAANASGQGEAIALAEQLMRDPWPLVVQAETPADGRYVDREIRYRIGGLDPAWGPGVQVRVAFGDGSELVSDAQALRQAGGLSHRYLTQGTYGVRVRADLDPGAPASAAALGEGDVAVAIAASPIGTARALAASFFNLRFALAVLVALLVQGWRLSAKGPFGARRLDYVEAFAIGAGSNLGLEGVQALFTGK